MNNSPSIVIVEVNDSVAQNLKTLPEAELCKSTEFVSDCVTPNMKMTFFKNKYFESLKI